jgi:potassium efflux system protein
VQWLAPAKGVDPGVRHAGARHEPEPRPRGLVDNRAPVQQKLCAIVRAETRAKRDSIGSCTPTSCRPGSRRRQARAAAGLVAISLLLISSRAGWPQQASPGSSPQASPQRNGPIPAAEIAQRARETTSQLRDLESALASDPEVEEIQKRLAEEAQRLERITADPRYQIGPRITLPALEDIRAEWGHVSNELSDWAEKLAVRADTVERGLGQLRDLEERWKATAAEARAQGLPEVLLELITSTRQAIQETETKQRAKRSAILTLQAQVEDQQSTVNNQLALADRAATELRRHLLAVDSPPLSTELVAPAGKSIGATIVDARREAIAELVRFPLRYPRRVALHALILVLLLALVLDLRRRSHTWPRDDEALTPAVELVSRPISAAVLIALLIAPVVYPVLPGSIRQALALLAVVPVLRILYHAHTFTMLRGPLTALIALFLMHRLEGILPPFSLAGRLLLLAESIVAFLWLAWWLRGTGGLQSVRSGDARHRPFALAAIIALALFFASMVANLFGAVLLALTLAQGTIASAYAAVAFYTGRLVLDGSAVGLLRSPIARRLRIVRNHPALVRRRMLAGNRFMMLAFWAFATLNLFSLWVPLTSAVMGALAATFILGSASLSLGSVLGFAVTLLITIQVARLVRFVLQEEVLPRVSLPRGVPNAISAVANYAVLLIGFLLAVAASGVEVGKVTLLAGAFGVGIGFGLQNIVNNFVSGLILIFERPIQVGDTIEVGNLTGEVKHIGIRSSTIRTGEGAEVIVPNANLVAEKVVNWTFSDHQRQIEIRVGVAYGNDPQKVIELLLGVARAHPETLEYPPPAALFVGFGESSLDFSLLTWTIRQDAVSTIRSEIAVAVYRALGEARIEIPVPQRDLRVRAGEPPVNKGEG